jgi:hypothetical protein
MKAFIKGRQEDQREELWDGNRSERRCYNTDYEDEGSGQKPRNAAHLTHFHPVKLSSNF